jgi:hypothetical protein
MHKVMHGWGRIGRDLDRLLSQPRGHDPHGHMFPQHSSVGPTRYAGRMAVPHKSTPTTTAGCEIYVSSEEANRRKS